MLSVQNNFGYSYANSGPPAKTLEFTQPNAGGDGLIVVADFVIQWPNTVPNLTISDSNGNTYEPLGACSIYVPTLRSYLQAWYVRSCVAGPNAVTVTETVDSGINYYFLTVSVFEYAGGFGPVDACAWATGAAQAGLSLSISPTPVDLIFSCGSNTGGVATITLDPSSSGFTTEQGEQVFNETVELLAVDEIVYSRGVQSVTFDFTQTWGGADVMFMAGLPLTSPPAPPAPPSPGSAGGWPTIF